MKIYLTGIGGIGMSAYAALMKQRGHDVSGSDRTDSELIEDLRSQGIHVSLNQDGSAMPSDSDFLVYSEAVPENAPERQKAKEVGIPQKSYFAALGELVRGDRVIAICGTHGKSSTTAMVAKVLMDSGLNPSVVVGTKMKELGNRNWRAGDENLWVVEACEYRKSFHFLRPSAIVLTNVDGDHFDAYAGIDEYRQAFVDFLKLLPEDGTVVIHGGDQDAANVAKLSGKNVLDADLAEIPEVGVPGEHMRRNGQLAVVVSRMIGVQETEAKKSLKGFSGTWRRMQVIGETSQGATVIDDYAHHPVEIKASIAGIKEKYPANRLLCIFEPHTNDRTLKLWNELSASFGQADEVLVTNVYDARPDKDKEQADVHALSEAITAASGVPATVSGDMEQTKQVLNATEKAGDVLLVMGAGKSTLLAHELLR